MDGWRRVVIEKPFGSDGKSARELNLNIHNVMNENQVYRIDHYLGKETVQNILVARFANTIFEPVWNRNYIENIQITVAEAVGVETRGKYYDKAGVVRDMFQNHLMQLLTLVAMEPTSSYKADALRDEKVKVISAIRPIRAKEVHMHTVRGQYKGYRQEANVPADSQTETFAAIRFFIDNWRWQGVPFYLRSGKKMKEKVSEISIIFKNPPHMIFPNNKSLEAPANLLSMCLQPDEGIHLRFETKVPDTIAETRSVDMDYHYSEEFGPNALPEAYERCCWMWSMGTHHCSRVPTRRNCRGICLIRSWRAGKTPRSHHCRNMTQAAGDQRWRMSSSPPPGTAGCKFAGSTAGTRNRYLRVAITAESKSNHFQKLTHII